MLIKTNYKVNMIVLFAWVFIVGFMFRSVYQVSRDDRKMQNNPHIFIEETNDDGIYFRIKHNRFWINTDGLLAIYQKNSDQYAALSGGPIRFSDELIVRLSTVIDKKNEWQCVFNSAENKAKGQKNVSIFLSTFNGKNKITLEDSCLEYKIRLYPKFLINIPGVTWIPFLRDLKMGASNEKDPTIDSARNVYIGYVQGQSDYKHNFLLETPNSTDIKLVVNGNDLIV